MTNYDKAFELISKLKLEDGEYEVTDALIDMAQWKEQEIIEWLKNHLNDYLVKGRDIDYIFEDLPKAMEE